MDEPRARRVGMTFIDLIVVIAILGIISALLMPVYANTRKKARQAHCAGNLHQLGTAIALYQTDYDGCWPTAAASPWSDAVQPYIRADYSKLGCSMTRKGHYPVSTIPGFAINSAIYFRPSSDSAIQFPSRTVAMCDSPWEVTHTASPDPWVASPRPSPAPESAWLRHQGGANYLFCDQHIKWHRPESVLPAWDHRGGASLPTFAVDWKP